MLLEPTSDWEHNSIVLFLLRPDDVNQAYVDWLNDTDINRYLESRFAIHDLVSTEEFVRSMLSSPTTLFFGIRSLELDRHVGNIKLEMDFRHGSGEIGLMIGDRRSWGRGIGSDAISAIAKIGKNQLGLRKITAGCYASNVGSRKAFERAGFSVEAIRPAHFMLDGIAEDLVLLAKFV